MQSSYSDKNIERSLLTFESIQDTISKLLEWNSNINSIVGMRNKIAHGYFELDADAVYETIIYDIPQLKAVIDEAVRLLKED